MPLLLTASQIAAHEAGAPVRQVWKIYVPASSGSTSYGVVTIHDDAGAEKLVTDAGSRMIEAYNQSMKEPGRLSSGLYRIQVANDGGAFYEGGASFKNGSYEASPYECHLGHEVYILVDGSWSQMTGVTYRGHITEMTYDDTRKAATLTAVALAVHQVLEYVWSAEDGEAIDTGFNISTTLP